MNNCANTLKDIKMTKKSSKINWAKHTIEVSVDAEHKYTIWLHNKSIDEHLSIVLNTIEYAELCQMLERMRYDS